MTGDTVGELDVITSSVRGTTLHAIRDTELVRMPLTLFNAISIRSVPISSFVSCTDTVSQEPKDNDPVRFIGNRYDASR